MRRELSENDGTYSYVVSLKLSEVTAKRNLATKLHKRRK